LSPGQLLVGDYLLRNSQFAQTASHIANGIHAGSFYCEHATNGHGRRQRMRRIPRAAIREYIKRLHRALAIAFHEANLRIDPLDVLTVEESVGNQVLYRWKAAVRWFTLISRGMMFGHSGKEKRTAARCSRFWRQPDYI
jgi:hypothetical protein